MHQKVFCLYSKHKNPYDLEEFLIISYQRPCVIYFADTYYQLFFFFFDLNNLKFSNPILFFNESINYFSKKNNNLQVVTFFPRKLAYQRNIS